MTRKGLTTVLTLCLITIPVLALILILLYSTLILDLELALILTGIAIVPLSYLAARPEPVLSTLYILDPLLISELLLILILILHRLLDFSLGGISSQGWRGYQQADGKKDTCYLPLHDLVTSS